MVFEKTLVYENLSGKEQEHYNYTIIVNTLKHYGIECVRLSLDNDGPDFIAHHYKTRENINVQQKGRFHIASRYENQKLWMAFVKDGNVYLYNHDEVVNHMRNTKHAHKLETQSYFNDGWHTKDIPSWMSEFIETGLIKKL